MRGWVLPAVTFASLGLSALLATAGVLVLAGAAGGPRVPAGATLAGCRLQLAALERRLETARGAAVPYLAAPVRFARTAPGTPSPVEATVRPALDRLLGGIEHRLECRGRVCRLDVEAEAGDADGWQVALLSDPTLAGMMEGFEVRGAQGDPRTREAFLVLGDPAAESGEVRLDAVVDAFRASGALAACAAMHHERGDLVVELSAGGHGDLGMWIRGGALTHTAAGACVESALRQTLAAGGGGGPLSFARRVVTFTLGAEHAGGGPDDRTARRPDPE